MRNFLFVLALLCATQFVSTVRADDYDFAGLAVGAAETKPASSDPVVVWHVENVETAEGETFFYLGSKQSHGPAFTMTSAERKATNIACGLPANAPDTALKGKTLGMVVVGGNADWNSHSVESQLVTANSKAVYQVIVDGLAKLGAPNWDNLDDLFVQKAIRRAVTHDDVADGFVAYLNREVGLTSKGTVRIERAHPSEFATTTRDAERPFEFGGPNVLNVAVIRGDVRKLAIIRDSPGFLEWDPGCRLDREVATK